MMTVAAFASRSLVALVTTGATVAIWTAAPLLAELVVTTTVKLPAAVGFVAKFTVREVSVADVTVPAALLNVTKLFAAVVSNPTPLMVTVLASALSLSEELATTTGTTLAT